MFKSKKSGVFKVSAYRAVLFAVLGVSTGIGNVYAENGCDFNAAEFLSGIVSANDGSVAIGNIQGNIGKNIRIGAKNYTITTEEADFDAKLTAIEGDRINAILRGIAPGFNNNAVKQQFNTECATPNDVKFSVKEVKKKGLKGGYPAQVFNFKLAEVNVGDVPPPPQGDVPPPPQGDVPPPPQGDVPPPPQGDVPNPGDVHHDDVGQNPMHDDEAMYPPEIGQVHNDNGKKMRWNGTKWVRLQLNI